MVKRKSSLASNEVFRVRILVGLLCITSRLWRTNGRATRLATGTGWKPVEYFFIEVANQLDRAESDNTADKTPSAQNENALRVRLPLLPLWPGPVLVSGDRL